MFKIDDIVFYKLHPEYGIGKVVSVPFLYVGYYWVAFYNVNLHICIYECDLLNANDFQGVIKYLKEILEESENFNMPNIKNYTYKEDIAVTTIEWSDGTKTTVRAENPDIASQYTGFVTAYAKKAAGNDNAINKLYDEWAVKKPAREMIEQIKANAAELEKQRIAKKRKAKKEEWLIRKRAAEIAKEYEAKKLANMKYGVPMDYKAGDSD